MTKIVLSIYDIRRRTDIKNKYLTAYITSVHAFWRSYEVLVVIGIATITTLYNMFAIIFAHGTPLQARKEKYHEPNTLRQKNSWYHTYSIQ